MPSRADRSGRGHREWDACRVGAESRQRTHDRQTSVFQQFARGARYPSKVRMIAVEAEIRQWSRRRAVGIAAVRRTHVWIATS